MNNFSLKRWDSIAPVAWVAVAVVALVVRARGLHRGLIYPDGYEYLLMAKGIATHLRPTLQLGPGGELFVPPIDAALKPLFPAVVALCSAILPLRQAANLVTITSGAAGVVLAGLVTMRLTTSWLAASITVAAMLISPALLFWNGFVGPDTLAAALVLGATLAALEGHYGSAGVLGAACAATRPEWLLALLPFAAVELTRPQARAAAGRALIFGTFTLAAVIALIRPPLATPPGGLALLAAGFAAGFTLQLAAAWGSMTARRALIATSVMVAAIAAAALSGRAVAVNELLRDDWPLLVLSAAGLLNAALRYPAGRRPALVMCAAALSLGASYLYRNAGSERYLAELMPLACVSAGFIAVPRDHEVAIAALAAGLLGLTLLVAPPTPAVAEDTFASIAPRLASLPAGTLVTAAPAAYGYLLPGRPVQTLRVGERGLVLLDGAQRAYDPKLGAKGTIVARISEPNGFERPNGTIDYGAATVIRGIVISR